MIKPDWDPTSEEVRRDQRAAYDAMRAKCPVAYSDTMHWSLFRHEDVLRVLLDHDTFSSTVSQRRSVPNSMDPPEHTPYRRIIEKYFTPERMETYEPQCRAIAEELVHAAVNQEDVEIMTDLGRAFSVRVQCAFLGWPADLEQSLADWMNRNHDATLAQDREAMKSVAQEFESYIRDLLQTRRTAGRDADNFDVTASLMQETVDGRPLTDEDMISIMRNWTAGEVGSIAASIGILTHFLATHPDIQTQLRDNPHLIPEAIEEILRMDGPLVANRRRATEDVEIGGRSIAKDEIVTIMWVSANRDEAVFDDPYTFRWGRDQSANLLYGAGVHVCPGAPLARLEMRVVVEELLRATSSIRLHPDMTPVRAVFPAGGYASLPVVMEARRDPILEKEI